MQICRCNIKVNSTYRSIKSDHVNLVAPASHVHRARPTLLTPAVCLPVKVVYRSAFESESYQNNWRLMTYFDVHILHVLGQLMSP